VNHNGDYRWNTVRREREATPVSLNDRQSLSCVSEHASRDVYSQRKPPKVAHAFRVDPCAASHLETYSTVTAEQLDDSLIDADDVGELAMSSETRNSVSYQSAMSS
jgi:hypothetical protein